MLVITFVSAPRDPVWCNAAASCPSGSDEWKSLGNPLGLPNPLGVPNPLRSKLYGTIIGSGCS